MTLEVTNMRTLISATAAAALALAGYFPASGDSDDDLVGLSDVFNAALSESSPQNEASCVDAAAAAKASAKAGLPKRSITCNGTTSQYVVYSDHLRGRAPSGILFYLHGDGYGEFTEEGNEVLNRFEDVARDNNLLMVAPVTPDKKTKTWWRSESSSTWLRAFILDSYSRYDVGKNNVWFAGFSGGSEEITNFLMTENSDLFSGGGALMVGGGSTDPQIDFSPEPGAALKKGFSMVWLVGALDSPGAGGADGSFDAVGESADALRRYRGIGMKRTSRVCIPNEDHNGSVSHGPGTLQKMVKGQLVGNVPCPEE